MDQAWKDVIWRQFGAALDMLENAVTRCPEDLWFDHTKKHYYWYWVSHTLFWTDFYLEARKMDEFRPPEPFGLEELDPAGVMPDPPYSKEVLLGYLEYCRNKLRDKLKSLSAHNPGPSYEFKRGTFTYAELLLYNMRHIQHHGAQLSKILRREVDDSAGWVGATQAEL
ncbi:DinB family protein [candidate division GN15 bacterium]|nr:DinB family protein [candidate division GN15 bacterium]